MSLEQHNQFQESIVTAANRLKADVEHCYNLLMEVRMTLAVPKQLELLRQVEEISFKVNKYCGEVIKEFQK